LDDTEKQIVQVEKGKDYRSDPSNSDSSISALPRTSMRYVVIIKPVALTHLMFVPAALCHHC
jgi:hypothetical protein